MDDEDDCCVNAAVPSPWDVAPACAARPAAGSGSTAALEVFDNDDDEDASLEGIAMLEFKQAANIQGTRVCMHASMQTSKKASKQACKQAA